MCKQNGHKWLKDRRGRTLSRDDIAHYQRVVVALKETIRLMEEIDAAIPGWPMEGEGGREPDTPRRRALDDSTLREIRKKMEQHIQNSYLKSVQAPAGVRPVLRAWMELS